MTKSKNYAEKLRDPRWQKRRLEILSKHDFMCSFCYDQGSTLHVHHLYYVKGRDPWEYPDFALVPLCDDCHAFQHDMDTLRNEGWVIQVWEKSINNMCNGDIKDLKIVKNPKKDEN